MLDGVVGGWITNADPNMPSPGAPSNREKISGGDRYAEGRGLVRHFSSLSAFR